MTKKTLSLFCVPVLFLSACDSSSGGSSVSSITGGSCHGLQAHASTSPSHLPRALSKMTPQGKLAENKVLSVVVALNLKNEQDLERRLSEIYTPGSPIYGRYLTPDEFKAQYAPSSADVEKVRAILAQRSFQNMNVNPNGYLLTAQAQVKDLNALLKTEIHEFKDAQGKTYFAPQSEPVIPKGLGIQAIHGLHNISQWHSHARSYASPGAVTSKAGSGHSGALSPSDVRGTYNMNISGIDGSGQTLAVFELDAYNQSDLTAYEQYYGLPNVSVTPIDVDRGSTINPGGGIAEVTLDIELMMAVAPGASILVYEGSNSETGILATYARIANDNLAKSISTSWGSSEGATSTSLLQSENTVFMQMAAQGQSIFSAAGDSGAMDNGSNLSIDDPSGQPYMTAVGGTTLSTNSGSYVSETTWTSGGGGISSVWSIPSWQQGLASSSNLASSSMRNIPDVAVDADAATGYDIYQSGAWGTWGGTSCAAPVWAAFMGLVNQARANAGGGPVGFVNPTLYAIGRSGQYSSDFHDIANGSTNGYYPAVSGYDDATGWGSMNGQNLFQDLVSGAYSSSPTGC